MIVLIIIIILTGLYLFIIAPGYKPREKGAEFLGLNYAHRGLHTRNGSVPENSITAFLLAAEKGYAAELDIRLTADAVPVVFHDGALLRMTGDRRNIADIMFDSLSELRLLDTNESIPSLQDVLSAVEGRVPLLIEIKYDPKYRTVCEKTLEVMSSYNGPWCVESFDPRVLKWFRHHAPEIWRGQLVANRKRMKGLIPKPFPFLLANVVLNFISRPHFIAQEKGGTSISVRMCELLGAAPFVWTVEDTDDIGWYEYRNLSVIFQYYSPLPRFRKHKGEH